MPQSFHSYPDGDFIFMQDNAPRHTSKTLHRLKNMDVELLSWPGSPDLNPCDYWLWSCWDHYLQEELEKWLPKPTVVQLQSAVTLA